MRERENKNVCYAKKESVVHCEERIVEREKAVVMGVNRYVDMDLYLYA